MTPDTIVAMATPHGESALALLRASGPDCRELASAIFDLIPSERKATPAPYRSLDGEVLDEVVFTLFRKPKSFTGENTLEISCHGNPLIAARILEDLRRRGCRAAAPGEFTRRAFLSGKIDLTQAEAVMEVIRARSDLALRAANNQLRGAFGRQLRRFQEDLLASVAAIEVYIDFPEEDLPPEEHSKHCDRIRKLSAYCDRMIDSAEGSALLRHGVKTLIVGAPNAGKSSLLNVLLGFERAIVSNEPGTTRDFLRERVLVGSYCIQLMDTAGLRERSEGIEKEGIRRTLELVEEADVFLLVLDSTLPYPFVPEALRQRLNSDNCIVVENKLDLGGTLARSPGILPSSRLVRLSALLGQGVENLQAALLDLVDSRFASTDNDLILVNERHSAALVEMRDCLSGALAKLECEEAAELVASDLRGALDASGSILGRVDNERMLDLLFGSFCIGK